jgi:predicted lipoprotein
MTRLSHMGLAVLAVAVALAIVGCGITASPAQQEDEAKANVAYQHARTDAEHGDRKGVEYWSGRAEQYGDLAKAAAASSGSGSAIGAVGSWFGGLGTALEALGGVLAAAA